MLACALAARADLIVSGDIHLLELASFRNISIVKASEDSDPSPNRQKARLDTLPLAGHSRSRPALKPVGEWTYEVDAPIMAGDGKMAQYAKYKDVIEFKSDDHRVPTSRLLRDDGTWQPFMTAHYRRNKSGCRKQCRFPQSSFDNSVEKGSSWSKKSASAAAQSDANSESHNAIHDADDPQGLRDCGARHDAGPQGR